MSMLIVWYIRLLQSIDLCFKCVELWCDWRAASTSSKSWTGTLRRFHWWFCHWRSVLSYHGSMVRLFVKLYMFIVCSLSLIQTWVIVSQWRFLMWCAVIAVKRSLSFAFAASSWQFAVNCRHWAVLLWHVHDAWIQAVRMVGFLLAIHHTVSHRGWWITPFTWFYTVLLVSTLVDEQTRSFNNFNSVEWKCEDFKCVWKPTESRLCLTHYVNKSSCWAK